MVAKNMLEYLVEMGAKPIGKKTEKFGNQRVELDGHAFDSASEAAHYFLVLKPELARGAIVGLEIHPKFVLIPKYEDSGKMTREAVYEADFQYNVPIPNGYRMIVEDVKGMETDLFQFKVKLLKHRYPWLRHPGAFRVVPSKQYSLRNAKKLGLIAA